MRHQKRLKKIGLPKHHRDSLLKNLVADLVTYGKLRTTESRAKALSSRFDRITSLIQRKQEKREAIRMLPNYCADVQGARAKLVGELKTKYAGRKSGFTRITRVGMRKGDNARLVQIELI